MKKMIVLSALCLAMALPVEMKAATTPQQRIAYVMKNMKLKGDAATRLKASLAQYYKELAAAKASHKALKEKLSDAEDNGKLTAQQCDQLFDSKQKQETAELAVRRKFYTQFKTFLTAQQAYKAIKLTDDKVKSAKD